MTLVQFILSSTCSNNIPTHTHTQPHTHTPTHAHTHTHTLPESNWIFHLLAALLFLSNSALFVIRLCTHTTPLTHRHAHTPAQTHTHTRAHTHTHTHTHTHF